MLRLAPALVVALGLAGVPGQALAASGPQRLAISGSHPVWATPAAAAGRDPAGLAAYAAQVSDPGSALYGRYLTPAQYLQRFGPTTAQVRAVRQWLTGAGLRVTTVTSHYVGITGPEAALPAAFGTGLRYYRVDGVVQRAPQQPLTVPAAVASAVLTVAGLATSSATITPEISNPLPQGSAASTTECSQYWGQLPATGLPPASGHTLAYRLCGYVPSQLAVAYGVAGSGLTGRGVTIAIVDPGASTTIAQDVNTYMSRHGTPPLRPGQLTQYLPSDLASSCGTEPVSYDAEEHLDIEAAHGMAPDADIAYVAFDCSSDLDPLDAETEIVDGHLADIVSNSWGFSGGDSKLPAGLVPAFEQVFEQGAAEGIGFYFASGDDGDESTVSANGQTGVTYPASDPWVTSVGGTSLATPLIASIQADAQQALGIPIGFANPAIYNRYGTPAYHDVTDDPLGPGITIATVDALASPPAGDAPDYAVTLAHDTSLQATPGYDDVTGVGTPTAAFIRSYWRR